MSSLKTTKSKNSSEAPPTHLHTHKGHGFETRQQMCGSGCAGHCVPRVSCAVPLECPAPFYWASLPVFRRGKESSGAANQSITVQPAAWTLCPQVRTACPQVRTNVGKEALNLLGFSTAFGQRMCRRTLCPQCRTNTVRPPSRRHCKKKGLGLSTEPREPPNHWESLCFRSLTLPLPAGSSPRSSRRDQHGTFRDWIRASGSPARPGNS